MKAIINSDNGYIIVAKGNQPKLFKSLKQRAQTRPLDAWSWTQTGHGHDVRCRIKVWEADEQMKQHWPGLARYISVRRCGIRDGKPFDTTTFYISSEVMSAWRFAKRIRHHRLIENTLHWTKDVVLHEDTCGLKKTPSAVNMAVVRNIGFNLLVMDGYRSISEGISAMGENIGRLWGMMSTSATKSIG